MNYAEFTDKLADKFLKVREEAKKDKFGEGIIAVRQATTALEFLGFLKGILSFFLLG